MALEMRNDLGIAIAGCYSMWSFPVYSWYYYFDQIPNKFVKSSYQRHSVWSGILTYTDPGISTVL